MVKIIAVAVIRKSVSEVMIRPFSVKCQERQRDRERERERERDEFCVINVKYKEISWRVRKKKKKEEKRNF